MGYLRLFRYYPATQAFTVAVENRRLTRGGSFDGLRKMQLATLQFGGQKRRTVTQPHLQSAVGPE